MKTEFILDAHLFLVTQGNRLLIIKEDMIITMTNKFYDNNNLQFMIIMIIVIMFEITV